MKTRLLSVLLVFLLLASVSIPAVSAIPVANANPAICLAPAAVKFVVDGTAVALASATALVIAEHLGKTWDGTREGLEQLMKDAGATLDKLLKAKKWVVITTGEGQALMKAVYECYTATSGSGSKKDGKWYFEARRNHGKIEINTERMDETQAVKEMGRGKNIMTLNEELAQNLVGKFRGLSKEATDDLRFEGDHNPAEGLFHHLHYDAHTMRLHAWSWE